MYFPNLYLCSVNSVPSLLVSNVSRERYRRDECVQRDMAEINAYVERYGREEGVYGAV